MRQLIYCWGTTYIIEKSNTIKWIDVGMPHKRPCRLQTQEIMARDDKAIFEDNVVIFRDLLNWSMCACMTSLLNEFQGIDDQGQRVHRKLGKPNLTTKSDQSEHYSHSLILLF